MLDTKQPMVTVKKADGTFAKVPLSEFKKMQAAPRVVIPTTKEESLSGEATNGQRSLVGASLARDDKKPAHQPTHHQPAHHAAKQHHAPVHHKTHTEHTKTTPASHPAAHPSGSAAPAHSAGRHPDKHMSRADAGSPLEEKLKMKSSAPLFSPKREKQVEEVVGRLGFSVAPEVLGRLKSLVLAKLKDIKSEEETRELLSRSIKNGGLGLTEQQVEKIIKSCQEVSAEDGEVAEVSVLKGKTNMSLMVEPPELPMVIPRKETVEKLINESAALEPVFKLNTRPNLKQSMQDVSAASMEMGPVEEIKSMTLTDFRRLSGNPDEAAKRLQQKMFNLQEESFVWYLEALAAYHTSPLYTEYMQAVCQSLAERKLLTNVLAMKNSIKLNEAMALIEMEKGL